MRIRHTVPLSSRPSDRNSPFSCHPDRANEVSERRTSILAIDSTRSSGELRARHLSSVEHLDLNGLQLYSASLETPDKHFG